MTDSSRGKAGLFLCLTAVATVVSVFARVAADADQPTLAESLAAISKHQTSYLTGGLARLVSGVTLLLAGWFLLKSWWIHGSLATQIIGALFMTSGILTAISGVSAAALAAIAPGLAESMSSGTTDPLAQGLADIRWFTGKAGFTAAGLGSAAATIPLWNTGGIPRAIAPASLVIGAAMLFIWVDAATVMHRVTGPSFLVWLLVAGVSLLIVARNRSGPSSLKSPVQLTE